MGMLKGQKNVFELVPVPVLDIKSNVHNPVPLWVYQMKPWDSGNCHFLPLGGVDGKWGITWKYFHQKGGGS